MYPLLGINDDACRALTDEQQSYKVSENSYLILEFISNADLYQRYMQKCREMKLRVRVLFVESEYSAEIWNEEHPKTVFLGYEYCPVPIDDQVATDLDWYEPFSCYREKLNEHGLFNSYEDAENFVMEYHKAMEDGFIGDGEIQAYIFRVSEVIDVFDN